MFQIGILSNSIHLSPNSDSNGFDMNVYPNILTPPMDSPTSMLMSPESGSSSPPYLISQNNIASSYNSYNISSQLHSSEPYLIIREQPIDKFRFRYKSEMSGTHGSLNGKTSDRTRKQTFPSVELINFHKPAVIRCSLYQYGREDMIHARQLHAHRLVKKQGNEEIDDPHDIHVNPETGFIAIFHSMGIIHTAKKFIVPELIRKNTILKREEIAKTEHRFRTLTKKEELEIKALADKESKCINLNVVCLRFDAFEVINNIYYPICAPVYTHGINNLKSALTGDLKIVRMDHCTSTCRGGREIFILVEKVTKKNIKVRFFELDDEDNEIWSDYGRFSDLDVHHQYAIVFKTPAYKSVDIDKQVKVYIELQRPSDGARSEPKDFSYTPCEINFGKKRPRYNSGDYLNSQFSQDDLPLTLNNIGQDYDIQSAIAPMNPVVNGEELEAALRQNNFDSIEFDNLCKSLIETGPMKELFTADNLPTRELRNLGLVMDTPKLLKQQSKLNDRSPKCSDNKEIKCSINDELIINRVKTEIDSFTKTKPTRERMIVMLNNLMKGDKYVTTGGDNVLHLMAKDTYLDCKFSKYFLQLLQDFDQSELIDTKNKLQETPLHIATKSHNIIFIEHLIKAKADVSLVNKDGNTALHIAAITFASMAIFRLLLHPSYDVSEYIDIYNYDGNTVLHLAIKANNVNATELLINNDANINLNDRKRGYAPLHLAVADKNLEIVKLLLESPDLICNNTDFGDIIPLKLAQVLISSDEPRTQEIYNIIENVMKENGTFEDMLVKEELPISNKGIDEVQTKLQIANLNVKYGKVTEFTSDCLNELSLLLDKSEKWKTLAIKLEYNYLLGTNLFEHVGQPTRSLLKFAIDNGKTVKEVRDVLHLSNETEGVKIIDSMVQGM